MAKDTEKLIRQLSLISYLMAERRPVTAMEIRRDVEGYSGMNEDAFARRFYADRSELEALGIQLTIDRPQDGLVEQENYSLAPENFYLPAVEFTDDELAALQTALTLLDGEFAYAEPLRLALQQLSWGRPRPDQAPGQESVALAITASAGGHDLSARLAKIETAIFRRKTITFEYYTMERDATGMRKVDPYLLLFQGGQFYLVGRAHERDDLRVFRLSRISGKVAYASKAEHDFQRPDDFDPREYANRIHWQYGEATDTAEVWISERIAWQVERHFGRYGEMRAADEGRVLATPYANPRAIASWVIGLGEHARVVGPASLEKDVAARLKRIVRLHTGKPKLAEPAPRSRNGRRAAVAVEADGDSNGHRRETAIRPERFARLVTLASILIEAGRAGRPLEIAEVCERLQISEQELREDVGVLNIVNFGAGSYVLYAEIRPDGTITVEPEPYGDSFSRPARLLPVEAKALVAAIDLIGDHLPEGSLASVRGKVVEALGDDPVSEGLQVASATGDDSGVARLVSSAVAARRVLAFEYYKPNEDEFTERRVEPYALVNGVEGWYVLAWDLEREAVRHFRLDRFKSAAVTDEAYEPREAVVPASYIDGWLRTGEVEASRAAQVWISPERARWAREDRTVVAELSDGAIVVEMPYKGQEWLVREVLKEAGDAAVVEPAEARAAVKEAAAKLVG